MRRLTPRSTPEHSRARRRLAVAVGLSVGAVMAAVVVPSGALSGLASSSETKGADGYKKAYVATASNKTAGAQAAGTIYRADGTHVHPNGLTDGHEHDHSDPKTKNAISRTAPVTDSETADPTTPEQARLAVGAAEAQRSQTEPRLSNVPVSAAQAATPTDRYNMFNACYGVQSSRTGRWLAGGTTPTFTATTIGAGEPLYFKPTELGRYLLYSRAGTFLDGAQPAVTYAATPGPTNDWVATMPSKGLFRFQVPGKGYLADTAGKATLTSAGTQVRLQKRTGCTAFPEVSTNVTGNPFSGVSGVQEVRGFIDAHTHGMAFEFLGGQVHCGRPWSPYGVEAALKDCPDHELTGGNGAVAEAFLSGKPTHDPVGWPTFKDWPAPASLTHEGTYYKWMERSWRAG
ncbi:MAG: hypothetical protein ABWX73_15125, partial [Marmoricola sp.]